MTLEDRFWVKVDRSGGSNSCWTWIASTTPSGYGCIRESGRGSRLLMAHRVSYELQYGPIPDDLFVCHSCDNQPCVNPTHLYLGTQLDNMRDASERNRFPSRKVIADRLSFVESHSTIPPEKVRQIISMRDSGLLHREIAEVVGVTRRYVGRILDGSRRSDTALAAGASDTVRSA